MTRLKMLAVTPVATLAIGAAGLAAAPTASARPMTCADVPVMLDLGNEALAQGKYFAASAFFRRASELMKNC